MSEKITVAVVQSRSVYLDLEASLNKALKLIEQAVQKGATLITFGETWLTGYPTWLDYCPEAALWNHEPTREVFAKLRQNSLTVPSKETNMLAQAAKDHGVVIVIGVNERVDHGPGNGTLYNSLLTFGPTGEIINHHRKLVPTYTERLVWGPGDGEGLKAVDTPGGRVGGLICWEHWMPNARQVLHTSAEQIHIAVWPTVIEMHQIASRHYAFEGRCYVLASGLIVSVSDLPPEFTLPPELADKPDHLLQRGGSAIIGPDGKYVVGPVYDEETILTAEIDLTEIDKEKMTLDVTGHYSRPDLFDLQVRQGSRHSSSS
jgi:nitrilase